MAARFRLDPESDIRRSWLCERFHDGCVQFLVLDLREMFGDERAALDRRRLTPQPLIASVKRQHEIRERIGRRLAVDDAMKHAQPDLPKPLPDELLTRMVLSFHDPVEVMRLADYTLGAHLARAPVAVD